LTASRIGGIETFVDLDAKVSRGLKPLGAYFPFDSRALIHHKISESNANNAGDWRIHAAFAQHLIHDVNILDMLVPESGAFHIMDPAYLDFSRLRALHLHGVGVICHQVVRPDGATSLKDYPGKLRRVRRVDGERNKTLGFLTNDYVLPAPTIAELYRARWRMARFFKWIKQHLRIKSFFGRSENAVNIRVWIAVSIHVLIARDHQQAPRNPGQPPHNPTDSERQSVRENPATRPASLGSLATTRKQVQGTGTPTTRLLAHAISPPHAISERDMIYEPAMTHHTYESNI